MSEKNPDTADRTDADVPEMMGPLWREHDEPRDGFEPVPFWMKAIGGAFLFWGGWYLASNSGEYRGDALDRPVPAAAVPEPVPQTLEQQVELGRRLFATCAVCHQAEGGGLPGVYPPLKDSEWVTGDKASVEKLARIVLYGVRGELTVKGEKYTAPMPGFGALWKDYQIAAVLTFVRSAWGNKGEPVTTEQVAAIRQAERKDGVDRPPTGSGAVTPDELAKLK
jgi:mono/diheme cytochrome c family protein